LGEKLAKALIPFSQISFSVGLLGVVQWGGNYLYLRQLSFTPSPERIGSLMSASVRRFAAFYTLGRSFYSRARTSLKIFFDFFYTFN
jgi:hypothetical protein